MEESILSPQDNDEQVMKHRDGLGLMVNTALAVHYSEWGEEAHLLKMTNCFKKKNNYGIDERTGIYMYKITLFRQLKALAAYMK